VEKGYNLQSEMLLFSCLYPFSLSLMERYLYSVSISLTSPRLPLLSFISCVMAAGKMDILFVTMSN